MFKKIHHLNFVVADLSAARQEYQDRLGLGPFEVEDLPGRGVATARVKVGDVWIVLVSPKNQDGPVARYLAEHGEGFFLLSFEVDDLDKAIGELSERGTAAGVSRKGLGNWQVADLDTESALGVRFHLTQEVTSENPK